jgi:hypothetical protein
VRRYRLLPWGALCLPGLVLAAMQVAASFAAQFMICSQLADPATGDHGDLICRFNCGQSMRDRDPGDLQVFQGAGHGSLGGGIEGAGGFIEKKHLGLA